MKMNWLFVLAGAQANGVIASGVLLTLRILNSNKVPIPLSGVMVPMKADMRRVLIAPGTGVPVGVAVGVGRMVAATLQFGSLVRPALRT